MQGVKLVSTPPAKTKGSARSGFPERFGRMSASTAAQSGGNQEMEMKAMTKTRRTTLVSLGLVAAAACVSVPRAAGAQVAKPPQASGRASDSDSAHMADMADHAMSAMATMDENMMKHMELTPERVPTHADSVRAQLVADQLKRAIAKYQDTATAVA